MIKERLNFFAFFDILKLNEKSMQSLSKINE